MTSQPNYTMLPGLVRYIFAILITRALGLALVLAIWFGCALCSPNVIPGPLGSISSLLTLQGEFASSSAPALWEHILYTGLRTIFGIVIGLLVFVPAGFAIGAGSRLGGVGIGLIEFARGIPAFMLIVVFVSLGLDGETARIACISLAGGAILADYTASAVRSLSPERTEILRAIRVSHFAAVRKQSIVPVILEGVLPASRISVGVCLIVSLVVEALLVPHAGLGSWIVVYLGSVDLGAALALVLVAGIVGWVGNVLVATAADIVWWVYLGRIPHR
jgi:NitT/TauT family transport system permease protein